MHTDAHPVKNNQQPPISFWHAKEGTLKKKHKMLRQIVLHTFSSGIYTMPLPSCLHLHISIALSPPPTVLCRSRQLIYWPLYEAALMAGQQTAATKLQKLLYVHIYMVMCVHFQLYYQTHELHFIDLHL